MKIEEILSEIENSPERWRGPFVRGWDSVACGTKYPVKVLQPLEMPDLLDGLLIYPWGDKLEYQVPASLDVKAFRSHVRALIHGAAVDAGSAWRRLGKPELASIHGLNQYLERMAFLPAQFFTAYRDVALTIKASPSDRKTKVEISWFFATKVFAQEAARANII